MNKLLFAGTALLLVVAFAVAVLVERGGPAPAPSDRPSAGADPSLLVRPGAPSLGPAGAKVTLVEFLDPACETCAVFYPEVKKMLAANPDRLRLVVRHVPFHDGSEAVVRMLEAARLQDRYWQALEALFAAQDKWARSRRRRAPRRRGSPSRRRAGGGAAEAGASWSSRVGVAGDGCAGGGIQPWRPKPSFCCSAISRRSARSRVSTTEDS